MAMVKVVPQQPEEIKSLAVRCQSIVEQGGIERLEVAVKTVVERGIETDEQRHNVSDLLKMVKATAQALEKETRPVISYFHGLHKMAVEAVKPFKDRLERMESALNRLASRYDLEKREKARREQEMLARAAEEERRRLEQEALKALRNGQVEQSDKILEQAESIIAPVVVQEKTTGEGEALVQTWEAEVVDPMAVVRAIAEGVVPLDVIKEWNLGFIKREAAKLGGLNWPGIKVTRGARLRVRV